MENFEDILQILTEELVPAMGCTEPISLAYASALAQKTLGQKPVRATVTVSGNILKNVKSVVVPNTGGMRGIPVAVAAGAISGRPEEKLEVLSRIGKKDQKSILDFLEKVPIEIEKANAGCIFDIGVRFFSKDGKTAYVRIVGEHTNVVRIERDGEVLLDSPAVEKVSLNRKSFDIADAYEFAQKVPLERIEPLVGRQIEWNTSIGKEGLKKAYGAQIGRILLRSYGRSVAVRAKALAAAGSDARMNGCCKPVVIVSGSGNQGMTACLPVVVYAEHLKVPRETLLRAVTFSDLVTIRLKSGIGRLSAYCGAVSAGVGAGAGICFLHGGNFQTISKTICNALAIASGIVCDGAKSSCAAKIASAVEAGLLGFQMARCGSRFEGGDGIVAEDLEGTIDNIARLARVGMRGTDEEIISIMIGDHK